RPGGEVHRDAQTLFGALLACPPAFDGAPVRYPGWHEAQRAQAHLRDGVPLTEPLYLELRDVARTLELPVPDPIDNC
ncbi:MAG: Ldh family oxidoreductase, partial [Pseudonocardiaceae bacterium]